MPIMQRDDTYSPPVQMITGGARRATAVGLVSALSRSPAHPLNIKANNRAMIRIRAIPFCQVSKRGTRCEGNAIGGCQDARRRSPVSASTKLKRPQAFSLCGLRVSIGCL
jgi:hypothetical protein